MFAAQTVPEMAEDFPEGVPLLSLLSIPVAPVPEEAAHLVGASDVDKAAYPLEVWQGNSAFLLTAAVPPEARRPATKPLLNRRRGCSMLGAT